jgi:MFS family permease
MLWSGQTISMLGTQVTLLALPAVAVLVLNASPFAVGLLGTFEMLGFPLFGLISGAIIDRVSRSLVMIVCDLAAAVAMAMVAVGAWLDFLTMPLLYVVAAVAGISRVFFGVAYQSLVPSIVDDDTLVDANAKLSLSSAAAEVGGPSVAGFLIELVRPATAVLVDAVSFVVSAFSLVALRRSIGPDKSQPAEPDASAATRTARTIVGEIRAGVRLILSHRRLRSLIASSSLVNFAHHLGFAVFFVFVFRRLGLTPGTLGVVFAIGGAGAVLGAAVATRILAALRIGPTLIVSLVAMAASKWLLPAAVLGLAAVLLAISQFTFGFFLGVFNISQLTLRQRLTPKEFHGRMNATFVTLNWSAVPVAFALGGALGSWIGLTPTLVLAAALSCTAPLWLVGPLRGVREMESAAG